MVLRVSCPQISTYYESDDASISHRFDLDDYAALAGADACSWAILTDPALQKRKRSALTDNCGPAGGAAPALLTSTAPVPLL